MVSNPASTTPGYLLRGQTTSSQGSSTHLNFLTLPLLCLRLGKPSLPRSSCLLPVWTCMTSRSLYSAALHLSTHPKRQFGTNSDAPQFSMVKTTAQQIFMQATMCGIRKFSIRPRYQGSCKMQRDKRLQFAHPTGSLLCNTIPPMIPRSDQSQSNSGDPELFFGWDLVVTSDAYYYSRVLLTDSD